MRGLVCGLLIGLSCATSGFATKPADREPFVMRVEQLDKYLDLTASQRDEVEQICAYFQEKQRESLKSTTRQEAKMEEAVYGNLKLMRKTLTTDQYRKYVMLLNATYNNNRLAMLDKSLPDVYLATNE